MKRIIAWVLTVTMLMSLSGNQVPASAIATEAPEEQTGDSIIPESPEEQAGEAISISDADIAATEVVYNPQGTAIPALTITIDPEDPTTRLTEDVDYQITVTTAAQLPGEKGILTIEGIGNYTDSCDYEYYVIPAIPDFTVSTGTNGGEILLTLNSTQPNVSTYLLSYILTDAEESAEPVETCLRASDMTDNTYTISGLQAGASYDIFISASITTDLEEELLSESCSDSVMAKLDNMYQIANAQIYAADVVYNSAVGTTLEPEITVTMGEDITLTQLVDYTIAYKTKASKPGDIGVFVIEGIGDYQGTKEGNYQVILGAPEFTLAWGADAGSITATISEPVDGASSYYVECRTMGDSDINGDVVGSQSIPASSSPLTCEFTGLTPSQEYEVSIVAKCTNNNVDINSDETIITCLAKPEENNNLKDATISIDDTVIYAADMSNVLPSDISVLMDTTPLVKDQDYTVEITTVPTLTTPGILTFKGINAYTGEQTDEYMAEMATPVITAATGSHGGELALSMPEKVYGAQFYRIYFGLSSAIDDEPPYIDVPAADWSKNTYTLTGLEEGKEYTVTVTAGIVSGDVAPILSGESNPADATAQVGDAYDISLANIEIEDEPEYSSSVSVYEPAITVTLAGTPLARDVHYSVSYSGRPSKPGDMGTITITGIAPYVNSSTTQYTIALAIPDIAVGWDASLEEGSLKVSVTQATDGATGYKYICTDPDTSTVLSRGELTADGSDYTRIITGLTPGKSYSVEVYAYYMNNGKEIISESTQEDGTAKPAETNNLKDAVVDFGEYTGEVTYASDMSQTLPEGIHVTLGGQALVRGTDYTVTIEKPPTLSDAGILLITGTGSYKGEIRAEYYAGLATPQYTAEAGTNEGEIKVTLTQPSYGAAYYELVYYPDDDEAQAVTLRSLSATNPECVIDNLEINQPYTLQLVAGYTDSDGSEIISDTYFLFDIYCKVGDSYNIQHAKITLDNPLYEEPEPGDDPYEFEPNVDVISGGTYLESDVHYTMKLSGAATVAGAKPGSEGTCTITGISPYYGTVALPYIITVDVPEITAMIGEEARSIKVKIASPVAGATGYAVRLYPQDWEEDLTITPLQEQTITGTTGEVHFSNLTASGKYQVVAAACYGTDGRGAYTDAVEVTASSENVNDIRNAIITINDAYYKSDNTPVVPASYTLTMGDKTLAEGADYTIAFSQVSKLGATGTVTITGIGNYSGIYTAPFEVALAPSQVTYTTGTAPGELTVSFTEVPGAVMYYLGCDGDGRNGNYIYIDADSNVWSVSSDALTNGSYTFTLKEALTQLGYEICPGADYTITVKAIAENTDYFSESEDRDGVIGHAKGYNVTFLNYDGSVIRIVDTMEGNWPDEPEEEPTRPATAKYEYTFDGYYPEIEDEGVTKDMELTARFEQELRLHNITFNANGGSFSSRKKVTQKVEEIEYGEKIVDYLTTCKRKGYSFAGWYTARKKGIKLTNKMSCAGPKTYYAHWKKVKVTKVKDVKLSSSKAGQIKITYKKLKSIKGYQVRYSTKSNMKKAKTVSVSSKNKSKQLKNLKKGKKYYVQIRAYKKDSMGKKVYGAWSGKKSIKTRK